MIFDEIVTALHDAKSKTRRNEIWIRVPFVSLWIDPISHKLLSMKADVYVDDAWSVIQEATRLGIHLFFGEIRRKCGALAVRTPLWNYHADVVILHPFHIHSKSLTN